MVALALVMMIAAQSLPTASESNIAPLPAFPDGVEVIGVFTPNAELLDDCSSKDVVKIRGCERFIAGIIQASGMITAGFPNGPIFIPPDVYYNGGLSVPRSIVLDYLNKLPNTRMSEPAAYSVYAALSVRYPYQGPHRNDLPLKIK